MALSPALRAADLRARMREQAAGQGVSEAQAADLTLTLSKVAVRPIQTWIRATGSPTADRRALIVNLASDESASVRVGQRVRVYSASQRSLMHQARVTRVEPSGNASRVLVEFATGVSGADRRYVVEIVADRGEHLSVPNEALIEEGASRHIVYVQTTAGHYEPRTVEIGDQGELYTSVTHGVAEGDQVVTTGSFFLDSEYKLKGEGSRQ